MFERVDRDGSGAISVEECVEALQCDDQFAQLLGFEGATLIQTEGEMTHVAVVLAALDENCDGKVSWAELRRAALGEEITVQDPFAEHMRDYEEYLRMVFDRVDKNGDGELSYAELVSGLKDPDFADEAGFYGSDMSRGEFAAEFCDFRLGRRQTGRLGRLPGRVPPKCSGRDARAARGPAPAPRLRWHRRRLQGLYYRRGRRARAAGGRGLRRGLRILGHAPRDDGRRVARRFV